MLARFICSLSFLVCFCLPVNAQQAAPGKAPIIIGFDAEAGHATSTSDDAIRTGMQIAIDEINARGGVLGRPLAIEERDNRSVPPRGVVNARAFGANPNVVAFLAGKFSPVVLEQLEVVHQSGVLLLAAWSAADGITNNGYNPNNVFRVSLTDSIAVAALMGHAKQRKLLRVGVFVPNTGWGRGSLDAARTYARANGMTIADVQWYNLGSEANSYAEGYSKLRDAGSEVILMVANEGEGSALMRDIASLPREQRLPVISHWGILGGDFPAMAGKALDVVDLRVVTTMTYRTASTPKARSVLEEAGRRLGVAPERLTSAVGVTHAYDLVNMLAIAIAKARTIDRAAVRSALERIDSYDGAMKQFNRPFSATRRDALVASDLQIVRFQPDGTLTAAGVSGR
jgi:branched-chain amino acid transport system substrate-binding protein